MDEAAQLIDRGFRHYEGERRAAPAAMRSVTLHSVRHVLGIRRSVWAKIVPTLTAFIAFLPAIVFVGVAVLAPEGILQEPSPETYADYYGSVAMAILLFTAFVGPEVLCPDRRTGMLGLYLASPLDRDRYLLAKAAAVGLVICIVTILPPLLFLLGNVFVGRAPDGVLAYASLIGRMVAAGLAISMLYSAAALAISSLTTRHAAATASLIVILIGSGITAEVLVHVAELSRWFAVIDLIGLPFTVVTSIFGGVPPAGEESALDLLPAGALYGVYVGWTLALAAVVRFRYQRLDVTR